MSDQASPVSLRLPADVLSKIDAIAEGGERSRSFVILRALRLYLQGEGQEILAALAGRREIAEGQSVDADDLLRELEATLRGKSGKAA